MGASLSSHQGNSLADVHRQWLLQHRESSIKYASSSSIETFEHGSVQLLALAYQASQAAHECSTDQHIRFQISKDGGETWSASRVVVWGLGPCWSPILFYDKRSQRLFLFYSESRKAYSPGGDIKYISSPDAGESWSPPTVIYTHEQDGECPKLAANKPVVDTAGIWYLAVQREPAESYRTFAAKSFHPLKEVPSLPKLAVPATAAPQLTSTSAGVLKSSDSGSTWTAHGAISLPNTWLIEPALEVGSKGQLLMLFRTAAGKVYMATSADQGLSWSKPYTTSLPNPNSKVATVTIDGQILCVYNNSGSARTPLSLALSVDDAKSWDPLTIIESDPLGKFSCPSVIQWSDDTVKVSYTVWGEGLRLATIRLATAEA